MDVKGAIALAERIALQQQKAAAPATESPDADVDEAPSVDEEPTST
jgi:hypothetical protein